MQRLLYLAIDALCRELLETHEPQHLLRLTREAAWADLASTIPPLTPPAWYTLHTGANSGEHGVFGLFSLADPEHYGPARGNSYLTSLDRMRSFRFWERAALEGMRVVVRDMMMCLPRLEQRSDVGCVAVDDPWLLGGSPKALTLRKRGRRRNRAPRRYREAALRALQRKEDHYLTLAADPSVDVLCLGFNELDFVMHQDGLGAVSTAEVLRSVDEVVGACVEAAGTDTSVLVVSDHGFATYEGRFSVPAFLQKNGLLTLKDNRVDFSRSLVYPTCCGDFAATEWEFGLYLNLKGRQEKGVVLPGEREQLIAHLKSELEERFGFLCLENPQYYHGPLAPWGPDLLLQVPHRRFFPCIAYDTSVEVAEESWATHSPFGIAVVRTATTVEPPREAGEVAPLALQLLGLSGDTGAETADTAPVTIDYDEKAVLERLKGLGYVR